jgi:hypothetical protein
VLYKHAAQTSPTQTIRHDPKQRSKRVRRIKLMALMPP